MEKRKFVTPEYTTAGEVKRVRTKFKLTQKEFAELLNVSKPTVERWERSEEPIQGHIGLLLKLLEGHPETVEKMKVPEKVYPIRLWYMHEQYTDFLKSRCFPESRDKINALISVSLKILLC